MKVSSLPIVRRLRRQLPIPILTRSTHTFRQVAEHESAHLVCAVALGGSALFAHVGATLGGTSLSHHAEPGRLDGACAGAVSPADHGPFTVAGMVWDGAAAIGALDGVILLDWLCAHVGPWPARHRDRCVTLVNEAKRIATRLLSVNSGAVLALADLIERSNGSVFDARLIRRTVLRHMPTRPVRTVAAQEANWNGALRGDSAASTIIANAGLVEMVELVKKEIACPSKAR